MENYKFKIMDLCPRNCKENLEVEGLPFCLMTGEQIGKSKEIVYNNPATGILSLCLPESLKRGIKPSELQEYVASKIIGNQSPIYHEPF